MRAINLANEKKRDAAVGFEALPRRQTVKMVLPDGREQTNVKFLKSAADLDDLVRRYGDLTAVGGAIIDGDPEVDMELVGKFIAKTHKLYLTEAGDIAYRVTLVQVLYNPDGSEKERHDLTKTQSNVAAEIPIQWSGRKFAKDAALRKFIFTRKYQIRHTSGLTFDFLYEMAQSLQESDSLMFVGAGKKGNEPILLTAGGEPYRGFLEGRVADGKYCLILHLTNMELKGLPQGQEADA
ncbi:MAG: hypothetical protein LBT26_04380 [Clostridiales Family XIII bacterium]|jgi:hypothetical protein|nr:hypothetical protein [Clostridiales Family XIII bacterium]